MGFWTYTYATIHTKNSTKESMSYGGRKPVILALPDGTFLEETHYDGYGHICDYDVLELVVDWNRHTLEAIDIIDKHLAECYQEQKEKLVKNNPDDQFRIRILNSEITRYEKIHNYLASPEGTPLPDHIEKRQIGIAIATYDWEQRMLKYPIKFVKNKKYKYDEIKGYSSNIQ